MENIKSGHYPVCLISPDNFSHKAGDGTAKAEQHDLAVVVMEDKLGGIQSL